MSVEPPAIPRHAATAVAKPAIEESQLKWGQSRQENVHAQRETLLVA
jgi:hypothetical protein